MLLLCQIAKHLLFSSTKYGFLAFVILKTNFLLSLNTDDVGYQIRTCGVLAFRKNGRNGRSSTRERSIEETDQRREIRRWIVKEIYVLRHCTFRTLLICDSHIRNAALRRILYYRTIVHSEFQL